MLFPQFCLTVLLLQWTSNISPVRFLNLSGVALTVTQGAGAVSGQTCFSSWLLAGWQLLWHGTGLGILQSWQLR
jgi:hypothetical protein